jgi:hypothetical protein
MACIVNINSPKNRVQALYIACPDFIKDALQMADTHFERLGTPEQLFLRLPCNREQYAPRFSYPGGEPEISHNLVSPRLPIRTYKRTIESLIQDERLELYYALDAIAQASLASDLRTRQSVTMIDCVLPEWTDFAVAKQSGTNPFTVRVGTLLKVQPGSGSAGSKAKRYMKSFNFVFEELKLRVQ